MSNKTEDGAIARRQRRDARVSIGARPKNLQLRFEAGLFYMTNQNGVTLEEMSRMEKFQAVSAKTLSRWCERDRWVARRSEFFAEWAGRARQRIGTELTRLRQRDIQDLESLRNLAVEKLNDPEVLPKSWEGVARILLSSAELRASLVAAVGEELVPSSDRPAAQVDDSAPEVLPEELKIAAREILRHRREASKQEAAPVAAESVAKPATVVANVPTAVGAPLTLPPPPREILPEREPLFVGMGDEDEDETVDFTSEEDDL